MFENWMIWMRISRCFDWKCWICAPCLKMCLAPWEWIVEYVLGRFCCSRENISIQDTFFPITYIHTFGWRLVNTTFVRKPSVCLFIIISPFPAFVLPLILCSWLNIFFTCFMLSYSFSLYLLVLVKYTNKHLYIRC